MSAQNDLAGRVMKNQDSIHFQTPEEKLLSIIRETRYGEVTVKMKDGKPVMAQVRTDHKLDT